MSITKALGILDDTIKFVQTYNFETQSFAQQHEQKYDSELEWPAVKVRDTFIKFFQHKHQHSFIHSSPVVPLDDPTLLFTNAGMNQFKPIFLGSITDDDPFAELTRACNSQKCIRAGGKHNDLDDVGKDTYHHTFFEMLGNWSFGDYFKKEAIGMAWDLLVNVYGLDKNRMYATYFEGDKEKGLEPDNEAKEIWLQYLPASRVLPFGMKDNFWEMGDTGPCGPCTEIHYDRLDTGRDAAPLVNADDATVIEIWNLVFIQFNRNDDDSLQLLPNKHVDTGMGFERITSILQRVQSNYDTDIFMPIIHEIQKRTNCKVPYQGKVGKDDVSGYDMAYRVVADHVRTLTFAVTDGAAPGSQGRDYVIRRICRRGVRYGQKLGGELGFFKDLVNIVIKQMGDAFPEIVKKQEMVQSIIEAEEKLFSRTLKHGEKRFNSKVKQLKKQNVREIPGKMAATLHTTFGFPVDLTILMAEEQGMTVNKEEYLVEMEKHKENSAQKDTAVDFAALGDNEKAHLQKNGITETDDSFKYEWKDIDCKVLAIFDSNKKQFIKSVSEEEESDNLYGIVLDKTSFYAESGGQVGDIGYIVSCDDDENNAFKIDDVREFGGYIIHIGQVTNGSISVNAQYRAKVDYENRSNVAPNHTMTHVLNFALRKVLGTECNQKGSLVDSEKLRFDYSTSQALNISNIDKISKECNRIIASDLKVFTGVIEYESALKINALRAMFGERYPKNVRVVSIGIEPKQALKDPQNSSNFNYSIELCGGTHLRSTSQAGHFVFLSDDALSAGIRRIVALTGNGAKRAMQQAEDLQDEFTAAQELDGNELSIKCAVLSDKVANAKIDAVVKDALIKQLKELREKDRANYKAATSKRKAKVVDIMKKINMDTETGNFVVKRIDVGLDKKALKEGIKVFYKNKDHKNVPIMLISCSLNPNDKNQILILAETSKESKVHCGKWVQSLLSFIDGPKEWKGGKSETKAEVQGLKMENVAKVVQVATQYMIDNHP